MRELLDCELEMISGAGDGDDGEDIVVTGHLPEMTHIDGNLYGRFYNDGIAQLYQYNGGFLGFGGHYDSMGNFTYSVDATTPSSSTSNVANTTPPGMSDSANSASGSNTYHFQHTDQP